jgi:hypothetical protein
MFGRIAAFEIRYQLRSPVFWVVFALFFLLAFGAMASSQIRWAACPTMRSRTVRWAWP